MIQNIYSNAKKLNFNPKRVGNLMESWWISLVKTFLIDY